MTPDRRPPHHPLRRVPTSLLVGVVTFLLFGGLLGFVASADDGTGPAFPSTYAVAEPVPGDRGTFWIETLRVTADGVQVIEPAAPHTSFVWAGTAPYAARDGTIVETHIVEQTIHPAGFSFIASIFPSALDETSIIVHYDAETLEPIATRTTRDFTENWTTTGGLQSGTTNSTGIRVLWNSPQIPADHLCGFVHPMQGAAQTLADGIRLFRSCNRPQLPFFDCQYRDCRTDLMHYTPAGWGETEHGDALILGWGPFDNRSAAPTARQTDNMSDDIVGLGPFWYGRHEVWFTPDVPYPVRMVAHIDPDEPIYDIITLRGFTRGDGEKDAPRGLSGTTGPFETAPRTMLGPDETGIDHPFPLSAAFAAARDDPRNPVVRDFIDRWPDAAVVSADYRTTNVDGRVTRTWTYILSDGRHSDRFETTQTVPAALDGLLVAQGVQPPTHETVELESPGGPFPAADALPAEVPTVAALFARWSFHSASPEAPNTWGFEYRCADGACATAYVYHTAGLTRHNASLGTDGVVRISESVTSTLSLDGENLAQWYSHHSSTHVETILGPDSVGGDGPGIEGGAVLATTSAGAARIWSFPSAPFAVGAGLIALVVTLLHALWPTLKWSLFAPLFSRIEAPRALRHPLRAELHRVVLAEPGIHFAELTRRTGRPRTTVRHHMDKLVATGLVRSSGSDGYACYFPTDTDRSVLAAAPVLKSDGARRVLEAVLHAPRAQSTIAEITGLARQTVHHHVRRLERAGLVRRQGKGPNATVTAGDDAAAVYAALDQSRSAATVSARNAVQSSRL